MMTDKMYHLEAGERAIVCERLGNHIGTQYLSRTLASVAIIRANGRKKYRGHTPYWLSSTPTYASHYKSGRNKADEANYRAAVAQLQHEADVINLTAVA
jgi:hypothetical protein